MPEGEATLIAMVGPSDTSFSHPLPGQTDVQFTFAFYQLLLPPALSPLSSPTAGENSSLFFSLLSDRTSRERIFTKEDVAHFRASFFLFFFSFSPPNIFSRFKTRNTKDKVVHDTRYCRNYVCERGNFLIDRVFNRVAVLRQGNQ